MKILINIRTLKEDDEDDRWEREKHSTLVQLGSIESVYASKVIEYNRVISKSSAKPNLVNEFSNAIDEFRNDVSILSVIF